VIDLREVLELVPLAHGDPEDVVRGATEEELSVLEADLGLGLPADLREWLRLCRCSTAGPGGLFGVSPGRDWLDIRAVLTIVPVWRRLGWIPVASDGCGNYYVLDTTVPGGPVGFVEMIDGEDRIQFYVASDFRVFLRELLTDEISTTGWPFDVAYIRNADPRLSDRTPSPWDG